MGSNKSEDGLEEFAELLEESFEIDSLKRGDIREAEILEIRESEIVVDVGVKRDGFVSLQDIERIDPSVLASFHIGDKIPVFVLNPQDRDGNLLVSINLGLEGQDWLRAQKMLDSGEFVAAEVIGHNRGGILVRFGRLEGFVPSSHAAEIGHGRQGEDRNAALQEMVGQQIDLKVIEVNQARRRLILSQRDAQRESRSRQKEDLLSQLRVGDILPGHVTGIRDFGLFVDIGGADGLVHVSELAWHRVAHPRDIAEIGDRVQVYILELDTEQKRIALSIRRTLPDPWEEVNQTYHLEQIVTGTVTNVVDFGAFVVLPDGIEGLLHVSEMADGSLTEPRSYLKRGDEVTVKIVRIEPDRRRIGFTQAGLGFSRPTDSVRDSDTSDLEFIEQEEDVQADEIEQEDLDAGDDAREE